MRPQLVKIEIEVTRLEQLPDAIAGGADVVLLDNMDDATVAEAVRHRRRERCSSRSRGT